MIYRNNQTRRLVQLSKINPHPEKKEKIWVELDVRSGKTKILKLTDLRHYTPLKK